MALPEISDLARVIAPVDLRNTPAGKSVAKVRLAFNENRYNQETRTWETKATFFVDGELWDEQAERLAETANQGDEIHVVGQLKTDQWEKDGEKKSKTALRIRRFKVFPKAEQGASGTGGVYGQNGVSAPQGGYGQPQPQQGGYGAPAAPQQAWGQQGGFGSQETAPW